MFKNYLKIAFRNLVKRKGYSFINIFGLAIGIASSILIFLYVYNEMTYDTFHQNADEIYLIHRKDKSPKGIEVIATTPNPLPLTLRNDYPELANVVSFFVTEFPVTIKGTLFKEIGFSVEPSVFQMFSFPLLKGNPETALADVNSVVITEDLAEKYFGNEDPIGQTVTVFNKYDFIITGILKKIPENSSIKFEMLVSDKIRKVNSPTWGTKWYSSGVYTFVQCPKEFTSVELENQLPFILEKYTPDWLRERMELGLQPLTSIHLSSEMSMYGLVQPNSIIYIYILIAIALSVLLIACFNFINLSTARYSERAREIGVRKVMGARRYELILQFLGESVLLSLLSLILGIILAELFLPEFNFLTGKELTLTIYNNSLLLLGMIGFGIFIGVFSGSYPAFFLAKYRPASVIRSQFQKLTSKGANIRRILIIAQFTISIILIISELVITRQLYYMKNHELGFNSENMLVIPTQLYELKDPIRIKAYVHTINNQKGSKGIISTAISEDVPGFYYRNEFGVVPEGWTGEGSLEMIVTSIDEHFLDTYQMQLSVGRNFSPELETDKRESVLLNEAAVRKIGWNKAVGKHFNYVHGDGPFTVIGVVRDIHFKSLITQIEPLVYRIAVQYLFLSVRIRSDNISETVNFLREQWQKIVQDVPFDYFFIDDNYARSYQAEEKVAEIIGIFSLLAVILACMGLLGLSALTVSQRTKEIGIRKVLGASLYDIAFLISKQFVILVLFANIIAFPIAYFLMKDWLQNYPYRIELGIIFFIIGGLLALVIAMITVSFQAIKAARANPVDSLRYE